MGSAFDPDSYTLVTQVFDALIHLDENNKLKPALATSWKQINPITWEFNLRKGVKFHNGENFDANSVKYTFDYILNPNNRAGLIQVLSPVKSVKVINDFKIQITTVFPDGMFLNREK